MQINPLSVTAGPDIRFWPASGDQLVAVISDSWASPRGSPCECGLRATPWLAPARKQPWAPLPTWQGWGSIQGGWSLVRWGGMGTG